MASKESTVDLIVKKLSSTGNISTKKMFGEYGIYCGEKIVALVCDDKLFVKPTPDGKFFLGECPEGPPYPGARSYFIISSEKWGDQEWLSQLMNITANQLLIPKKKKSNKSNGSKHLKHQTVIVSPDNL